MGGNSPFNFKKKYMNSYTITEEMLQGIISYAYDCGSDTQRSLGMKNYVSLSKNEVTKMLTASAAKHDKDVKDFSKNLDQVV
tara:strand:+ start:3324 stop:3569 length:246 start_codon:yes stop_codon:yes gene_type:complete